MVSIFYLQMIGFIRIDMFSAVEVVVVEDLKKLMRKIHRPE